MGTRANPSSQRSEWPRRRRYTQAPVNQPRQRQRHTTMLVADLNNFKKLKYLSWIVYLTNYKRLTIVINDLNTNKGTMF